MFWNHPGWKQKPQWFPMIAAAYAEHLFQGIELVNGLDFYAEAFPWVAERKLAILANTDTHEPTSAEYRPRTRPITLVFARSADEAGIRDALFARRTAAWVRGQLWGSEDDLRGLWEKSVSVENPDLQFAPGSRVAVLRLRNRSAIPFRLRAAGAPVWLLGGGAEVPAEQILALPLTLAPKTPPGSHRVELYYELTNLHTAPGQNLTVSIPLTVEIR